MITPVTSSPKVGELVATQLQIRRQTLFRDMLIFAQADGELMLYPFTVVHSIAIQSLLRSQYSDVKSHVMFRHNQPMAVCQVHLHMRQLVIRGQWGSVADGVAAAQ